MNRGASWIGIIALTWLGCVTSRPVARHRFVPTCEGMCEYYVACAGHPDEQDVENACLSDCQLLYAENGDTNERMLWQLQQLECPELLAYIEGEERTPLRLTEDTKIEADPF